MNHDDEKNPDLQTWINPELEARLVAAVLGEASVFEQAELERLAAEKPELAIFKRRIEAVHGLLGEAFHPAEEPLQLSAERRAKVIAAIGPLPKIEQRGRRDAHILREIAAARRERLHRHWWSYGFAAAVAVAALIMLIVVPSFQKVRYHAAPKAMRDDAPVAELVMPEIREEDADTPQSVELSMPQQEMPLRARSGGLSTFKEQAPPTSADFFAKGEAKPAASMGYISEGARRQAPPSGAGNQIFAMDGAHFGVTRSDLAAPEAAPTADDTVKAGKEAVVLSPFSVRKDEDDERGYAATSTLAGSRVSLAKNDFDFAAKSLATGEREVSYGASASAGDRKRAPVSFDASDGFLWGLAANSGGSAKKSNRPAPEQTSLGQAATEDKQLSAERPTPVPASGAQEPDFTREIATADESVSTFSLHVSDASYKLAQAALARDEQPDPTTIRPEEFYNAFDYGDPAPAAAEKIACRIEQAVHPLLQQRNLLRIAMRVPTVGRGAAEPLRLTVLLDTSGSMEREDRAASVQAALQVLAKLLGPNDRVTLIGFARQARLLAEELPGNEAGKLAELAGRTPYTGGTNLEEGLKLAGELARRHRTDGAQNRIVLITDGAANLGSSDPQQLAKVIEQQRQQGIAFDACGVGTDGMDDAILEALTRKGDGRYYVIDRPEEADANFARQLAGAFRPAAENVKVQVRFNPARVAHYRLIGFEQHRLKTEDFRNDKVDAAELAAGEAAVALYQVEVLPQGEGELGDVYVRFRDPASRLMVERSWTIVHEAQPAAFDKASPSIQLAGTAALLAEKLRGGDAARAINLNELEPVVNALRGRYADDQRVQEFIAMFEKVRRRDGG